MASRNLAWFRAAKFAPVDGQKKVPVRPEANLRPPLEFEKYI
jgi:hypothetical protein